MVEGAGRRVTNETTEFRRGHTLHPFSDSTVPLLPTLKYPPFDFIVRDEKTSEKDDIKKE
jgi:hypothetical protein